MNLADSCFREIGMNARFKMQSYLKKTHSIQFITIETADWQNRMREKLKSFNSIREY